MVDPSFHHLDVLLESGGTVTARLYTSAAPRLSATLVLGHGAGAGQTSGFMVDCARGLAARGLEVVTFNFPYTEARRRIPDPNGVLEATWRAVVATVAGMDLVRGNRMFIGGKSMGGRIASQVAAAPDLLAVDIAGLVFLGYPLHPPGRPEKRRDAHLAAIQRPMLFVQGERDPFGTAEELQALVAHLRDADLRIVPTANHSLDVAARKGGAREAALDTAWAHVAAWVEQHAPSSA